MMMMLMNLILWICHNVGVGISIFAIIMIPKYLPISAVCVVVVVVVVVVVALKQKSSRIWMFETIIYN